MNANVKRTERGWPGHFICAAGCLFRRNTLLEFGEIKIVVSTVGNLMIREKLVTIGCERHFETMAFHAEKNDVYWDADISRQISFGSNWSLYNIGDDRLADEMHESVVEELTKKLKSGMLEGELS